MKSMGGGGCLSRDDSAISCDSEHFSLKKLGDLKRNDNVLSYDFKTDKYICSRIVAQVIEKDEPTHFYRLHLDNDLEASVKLTGNHLVYIIRGDVVGVKAAGDVKLGEVVRTKFGDFAVAKKSDTMEYPTK